MSMYGKDHEYAHSRLEQTVVSLNGEPVFVMTVKRGMLVTYSTLKDMTTYLTCRVDDLDLRPVKLGYCNNPRGVTYLMRMPMRRDWRQGLRFGNFIGVGFDARHLAYTDLYDVIKGKYPTLKEVVVSIKTGKAKALAWCREWAISADDLLYKGQKVGKLVGNVPVLDEENCYLREALEEAL